MVDVSILITLDCSNCCLLQNLPTTTPSSRVLSVLFYIYIYIYSYSYISFLFFSFCFASQIVHHDVIACNSLACALLLFSSTLFAVFWRVVCFLCHFPSRRAASLADGGPAPAFSSLRADVACFLLSCLTKVPHRCHTRGFPS